MKDKALKIFWFAVMVIIGCAISQTLININKYLNAQTTKSYLEIEKLRYELDIYKESKEMEK